MAGHNLVDKSLLQLPEPVLSGCGSTGSQYSSARVLQVQLGDVQRRTRDLGCWMVVGSKIGCCRSQGPFCSSAC